MASDAADAGGKFGNVGSQLILGKRASTRFFQLIEDEPSAVAGVKEKKRAFQIAHKDSEWRCSKDGCQSHSCSECFVVTYATAKGNNSSITWERDCFVDLAGEGEESSIVVLPRGSCNLYSYPLVNDTKNRRLEGDALKAFDKLLVDLFRQPSFADWPDEVGAFPIHILLVSNTREGISLALRLFSENAKLMCYQHTQNANAIPMNPAEDETSTMPSEKPPMLATFAKKSGLISVANYAQSNLGSKAGEPLPFGGENCLHILIANNHEREFVECLKYATRAVHEGGLKLRGAAPSVHAMLSAQARGSFFKAHAPVNFYGSTPFSYAAVCCFKVGIAAILDIRDTAGQPLFSLTSDVDELTPRCCTTGFSPLHAVVANGLTKMYDWLAEEEAARTLLSDSDLPTREPRVHRGDIVTLGVSALTCAEGQGGHHPRLSGMHATAARSDHWESPDVCAPCE